MVRVTISELKNGLSRFLKVVRAGEEIEVRDRDLPIARILPIGSAGKRGKARGGPAEEEAFLEEAARRGILRRGSGKIPRDVLEGPIGGKPGVLAELIAERREGR